MIPAARRVECNDRTLTHLLMCEPPIVVRREGLRFDMTYISDDRSSLKALCDGIGNNEHLEDVCFDAPLGMTDRIAGAACFEGLRRNASIRSLGLSRCELSRGVGKEVLRAFEENPAHLTKFAIWRCGMRLGGTSNLTSTLMSCRHLQEISLSSCRVDDATVREIVAAISGHHQLSKLDLQDNHIGRDGCEALSTLLHKPNCKRLRIIDLGNNNIDDGGAESIAEGLRNNDTLEAISLEGNAILAEGWTAISNVLCDTSSPNATHSSNHTLRRIVSYGHVNTSGGALYDEDDAMPGNLLRLVELNGSGWRKDAIARRKVLRYHFVNAFRMEPFLEESMNWKALPHVVRWVGQARDAAGCTAMLNLLREMPALCAAAGAAGGSPRKRSPRIAGDGDISPACWRGRLVPASRKSRLAVVARGTLGRSRARRMFRKMRHSSGARQGDRN